MWDFGTPENSSLEQSSTFPLNQDFFVFSAFGHMLYVKCQLPGVYHIDFHAHRTNYWETLLTIPYPGRYDIVKFGPKSLWFCFLASSPKVLIQIRCLFIFINS